ncbi:MAG: flavodoxin-dependent (E)-4-hydroxy-3-methylbut-2-enyl-diphosphate synthase [Erysipelothrix sp.]|nr:flavodoxin-dependent (E)-4-hydroxy-3-methylbut-2-enyl-diphosphate synthase [Erysipelothrix sp.]
MHIRENTRKVKIGNIQIGNQNKVVIQSMTNTKTKDTKATIKQINELEAKGCQVIRVAVLDNEDALAIKEIKKHISIPLVADIHFNYKLAITAIEAGADKIRINPGNIGKVENVQKVVEKCKQYGVPIRIGINSGSIEERLLQDSKEVSAQMMVESAKSHVKILEDLDFFDIILSLKASDVRLTIDAYRLAAQTFNYPLHLGVTEAGTLLSSTIKSSSALGILLEEGIGDTIRISITGDPVDEIRVAKLLLSQFNLAINTPNLVSCPTCGRIQFDMIPLANKIEKFLDDIKSDITVAIMGCVVNGLQEGKRADIGVAGGNKEGIIFKKGEIFKKVAQADLYDELTKEILIMVSEQ